MSLNYEVKKRVFGFDETKTEKFVAQMKTLGMVDFKDLCDEVSKIGMAPRGVVKLARCAIRTFTRWIKRNKKLYEALEYTGYNVRTRTFWAKQVSIIVQYLDEP